MLLDLKNVKSQVAVACGEARGREGEKEKPGTPGHACSSNSHHNDMFSFYLIPPGHLCFHKLRHCFAHVPVQCRFRLDFLLHLRRQLAGGDAGEGTGHKGVPQCLLCGQANVGVGLQETAQKANTMPLEILRRFAKDFQLLSEVGVDRL
jgi:hypothetical protein